MNPKSLLIPVAAFAVAVTGVQAFNSDVLQEAGLSADQITAFVTAKELRQEGDRDGARDVLAEAGIDEEAMQSVREVMREKRGAHRAAIHDALDSNDFEAFRIAVEGSPLADIVTTEADFEHFKEAHAHRQVAKEIMEELGIEGHGHDSHQKGHHRGGFGKLLSDES